MTREASSPFARLRRYALRDRPAAVRAALWQTLQSLTYLPLTAGLTWLVDHVLTPASGAPRAGLDEGRVLPLLGAYLLANALLYALHAAVTARAFRASQSLARATTARLRSAVVDQLQCVQLSVVARKGAGALANQLTVDLGRVEGFVGLCAARLVPSVALGIATLAYLFAKSPALCLAAFALVPLQALVLVRAQSRLDALSARAQQAGESFGSAVTELTMGLRHVRALGYEEHATSSLRGRIEALRDAGLDAGVAMTRVALWMQAAHELMPVFVWCVGGWMHLRGRVSLGELVTFTALLAFLQGGVSAAGDAFREWVGARPGWLGVLALLDEGELEDEAVAGADSKSREASVEGWDGSVRFDAVRFAYQRPDASRAVCVLDGVSFRVARGERVALVGDSGAGKSTALDLLMGFLSPTEGAVTFGGRTARELGRRALRRRVAMLTQEAFLFRGTVRENVRMGRPDASNEEIALACKRAGLARVLDRLPAGLETEVGERGASLSGGERQRVAIARMFLRDPALVLLDEPTSSLDAETERALGDELAALCAGRSAVIVSHRLHLVRDVDRVLVLRDGRVIEEGPPQDLLAQRGAFAALWTAQGLPLG